MRFHSVLFASLIVSGWAPSLANAQPRSDRNGDPLPAGAIARLGSAKFVHGGRLCGLSLSPDGSVVLGADERRIIIWDTATGRELREFRGIDSVRCAALSPDGKFVAASDNGSRVYIWDAKTGKELRKLVSKTGFASPLTWSPDSKSVAAYADKRVNLWDAASGEHLHYFGHESSISSIAFSPDGKRLVTSTRDGIQRFWDIASEKEMAKLEGGPGLLRNCSIAPDGKTIVGYCEEKKGNVTHCSLRSWDVETGKKLRDYERGYCGFAGFLPGGKSFLATHRKNIRVYDFLSGEVLREWKAEVEVGTSCLSGDGRVLAVDVAGRIRFWNPATGKEFRPPSGHMAGVSSVSFSPNGTSIASGSKDGTVRIWDWTTGKETARHLCEAPHGLPALQYRSDGSIVVLDTWRDRLRLWNPTSDRVEGEVDFGRYAKSMAIHPDGKTILTSGLDDDIGVRSWEAKKETRRIKPPIAKGADERYGPYLESLSLSSDGRSVAWAAGYGGAGIVDFGTGKATASFKGTGGSPEVIERVLFSPDGTAVATTHHYGHLQIWSSQTGVLIIEWLEAKGQALAYSPDGRFIALAGRDIVIWDIAARKELIRFAGHRVKVNAIAFEPRGRVLASASEDGTLLVWDLTGVLANAQLPKKALTEREMIAAWDDLNSGEPPVAQKAVVALACGGAESVAFIGKKLAAVPVVEPKKIDALVVELGDRDFRIREIESRSLATLGEIAEPALLRAVSSDSLEVRERAEALLLTLAKSEMAFEWARPSRALAALEYADGPEAKGLLSRYAAGDPGSRLTRQAKAALERVARQELVK